MVINCRSKAILIATGIINLRFIVSRFKRLQAWQIRQERQQRNSHYNYFKLHLSASQ
jgi:5-carboxymethyl-2-hydroxymuconate isomerase